MKRLFTSKIIWLLILVIMVLILGLFKKDSGNSRIGSKAYSSMLYLLLDHSVNEVSVEEALALKNPTILDAREPNEYSISHLKGSINIGYKDFAMDSIVKINKEDTVLIYCSVGKRSENIAKQMKEAGYTNVYNLYGGIFEWKNQGQPVYKNQQETNDIHAYDKTWGIWVTNGNKVFD